MGQEKEPENHLQREIQWEGCFCGGDEGRWREWLSVFNRDRINDEMEELIHH